MSRLPIRPGALLAVWTAPAILACAQRWATSALAGSPVSITRIALADGPGWYLWAAMTPAIFLVAERFPLRSPLRARAVAAHLAAWTACLLLHATVTTSAARAFDASTLGGDFSRYVGLAAVSWLPSTFLLYVATVGVAFWMRALQREQMRERERAALGVQLARAELHALRSQLHPHFLFNTLNTIAILIRERDTVVAARLVTQLGDLLRHVLHGARDHETALHAEIALVSTYLDIEQVRFGERLSVRWAVAEDARDAAVPSLVLQPLVENALRHGIARRTTRGIVEIGARRDADGLLLWILDNGPAAMPFESRAPDAVRDEGGVGLRNTRERLARLYPQRSSLHLLPNDGGGTRVEVRLPFREWPTSASRIGAGP